MSDKGATGPAIVVTRLTEDKPGPGGHFMSYEATMEGFPVQGYGQTEREARNNFLERFHIHQEKQSRTGPRLRPDGA